MEPGDLSGDDPQEVAQTLRAVERADRRDAERGASRGRRGSGDAFVTFASRLNEYAYLTEMQPTRSVVVAHRAGESGWAVVRGELRAFAWAHVYVAAIGGSEVFLPLAMIAYIHWSERFPPVSDSTRIRHPRL